MIQSLSLLLSITRFRITTFCSRKIVLCSSKNWILFISSFLQLRKCCLSISGTTPYPFKSKKESLHSNPKSHLEMKENTRFEKCRLHTKVLLDLSYQKFFLQNNWSANLRWDDCLQHPLLACGVHNDLTGRHSEKCHWEWQVHITGICVLRFLAIPACVNHYTRHWQHGITPLTLGSTLSS